MTLRTCTKCQTEHPVEFFNKDRTRPDGLYPQCKACSRAAARKCYRDHEEQHKKIKRRWKAENRPRNREINLAYRSSHVRRANAASANHRARKLSAMPPWVDVETIYFAYEICPPGFHVDHIHPLRGKDFCGLHVPHNLQFLPAFDNFSKNNRLPANAGVLKNV